MNPQVAGKPRRPPAGASLFLLLKPYRPLITTLVIFTILGNALNLVVPKLIAHAIDDYTRQNFVLSTVVLQFFVVAALVFTLTYLQSIAQTYASERVAKDLRTKLTAKIATQSYSSVEKFTPAKLLTNLTSDVDGVKVFVSQAVRLHHCFAVPDRRLQHHVAHHQLAPRPGRPGGGSRGGRHILSRVAESARAVPERPGSD